MEIIMKKRLLANTIYCNIGIVTQLMLNMLHRKVKRKHFFPNIKNEDLTTS